MRPQVPPGEVPPTDRLNPTTSLTPTPSQSHCVGACVLRLLHQPSSLTGTTGINSTVCITNKGNNELHFTDGETEPGEATELDVNKRRGQDLNLRPGPRDRTPKRSAEAEPTGPWPSQPHPASWAPLPMKMLHTPQAEERDGFPQERGRLPRGEPRRGGQKPHAPYSRAGPIHPTSSLVSQKSDISGKNSVSHHHLLPNLHSPSSAGVASDTRPPLALHPVPSLPP